jgi:hypothetical protein
MDGGGLITWHKKELTNLQPKLVRVDASLDMICSEYKHKTNHSTMVCPSKI